jgi:hypothetical protein
MKVTLSGQATLRLLAFRVPDLSNLILGSVDRNVHLVEGVLLALFKLFPAKVNALLSAQAGVLLFNLRKPTGLKRRICRLESSLGVTLNLGSILVRQGQSV